MASAREHRAVVVGAGPNGLAAAVRLAREGWRVTVYEANETVGGAVRSLPLTRPGFVHDFGAAIFPLGVASPFFKRLPLQDHGLEWIHPEIPVAHPLDGGRAAFLYRSLSETAANLGGDGPTYTRLIEPIVDRWSKLDGEILQPLLHVPRHPFALAHFGIRAMIPAGPLARLTFREEPARALWAGIAAHSAMPFTAVGASAFGLLLAALGHHVGWPLPRGGAGAITDALASNLRSMGGEIVTKRRIDSLEELPHAKAILLDVPPRGLLHLAGDRLPVGYQRSLARFRHGPGTFKIDYALDAPIPWTNADVAKAGTVHLGGTLDEIALSEQQSASGQEPDAPYVLLAQPSLFDLTRAPTGKHTAWAYCHVPNGSTIDMTDRIEAQIERFAPGFRDRILERRTLHSAQLEAMDWNLVGGDVSGGANTLWQMVARPTLRPDPYRTPIDGVYLCSASTPPGGGVHGMCGFHAAEAAIQDSSRRQER